MSQPAPDPFTGPTNAQVARTDHDLLVMISTKLDIALQRIDDQERRIRALETRVAFASALAALLGAGGGLGLERLLGG